MFIAEKLPIYVLLPSFILLQVAAKKLTLKNVTDYIVNVICKRSDLGYNYGVILIPEGLIDFIPEVSYLSVTLVAMSIFSFIWTQCSLWFYSNPRSINHVYWMFTFL